LRDRPDDCEEPDRTAFADKAGASIVVHGTELIPIAGNIISAGAALHDVFGDDGMIAA
jgi:hypothetical protein